ncbi:MAG: hypothetical protein NT075_34530 [Chloroflexi bacterium]|nr:hypothetical protein [Chloroflexota bacterium]
MWTLNYSEEVKTYFVDNEPYCFDLLVRIEELKFDASAVPPEGLTPLDDPEEPSLYLWLVLAHAVILRKIVDEKILYIIAVRPLE